MLKLEIDEDSMDLIAEKIAGLAFEKLKEKFQNQDKWPPLLSKSDLEKFLGIKNNKASELLNREDFPVTREFGRPKVPTHLLISWIDTHTDWVETQAPEYWQRRVTG